MNVLIVGGGSLGGQLAGALAAQRVDVVIVEKNDARVSELRGRLTGVEIIHGDGDEPIVLESAHITRASAVVAATDEDEDNLVACLLARREYAVPWTLGRVNKEANTWLFGERFGVDEAVPKESFDTDRIAQTLAARG